MSSSLGVDQVLLNSQNDTRNFNATGHFGGEGYEFTVISIATSVLLGIMTLTTIIGRICFLILTFLIVNSWGFDQVLLISQNETRNFNAKNGHFGGKGYEFTIISIT